MFERRSQPTIGSTRRHGLGLLPLAAATALCLGLGLYLLLTRGESADPDAAPIVHAEVARRAPAIRPPAAPAPVADATVAAQPVAAPQAERSHTVGAGEILGALAKRYGCSVAELKRANGLANDTIFVGQVLKIPVCGTGVAATPSAPTSEPTVKRSAPSWRSRGVDTKTLAQLMKAKGFKAPQRFKAFVVEISFDPSRQYVVKERAFDYNGSSDDADGWNPASTVKLFAAIAVLQRVEKLGFSSKAKVTFHSKKEYTTTVAELIQAAIIDSDNIAYNRLVQLASFDYLNETFLSSRNGVQSSALTRAYQTSAWTDLGENTSLRASPAITLVEGKRKKRIDAQSGDAPVDCSAAACTTLQDLAEVSRRLMLQEQLPESASFNLGPNDLVMLRRAMRAERARGNEVVDVFADEFNDERVRFYSKPGFAGDWFSDNIYIFDPRVSQAWIVSMAGNPGRRSLDSAASAIAKIIASGELRAVK